MKDFVLLLQNPMAIDLYKLEPSIFVFDTIDNWLVHPQMKSLRNILKENYEIINKEANIITSVSRNNFSLFKSNKNLIEIPNGVNLEFFKPMKVSREEKKIVFGYIGKIQSRFDFNLLDKCASYFKHEMFYIYGPILDKESKYTASKLERKHNNIFFRGEVNYNKLPKVINNFDICLIPHKNNEFTKSMSPLKIFEYISCGKQVVSTQIHGVENISEYIYLSKSDSSFIKNCESAIEKIQKYDISMNSIVRESISKEISWENRKNKIIEVIEKHEN